MVNLSCRLSLPGLGLPRTTQLAPRTAVRRVFLLPHRRVLPPRPPNTRLAAKAFRGTDVKKIDDWRVQKMQDMVTAYFDEMLSKSKLKLVRELLDENVQHKDMVRDEMRRGHESITSYLKEVRNAYPDFWARAEQVGVADECTVFCSFEGQAHPRSPMFTGVDRFKFNKELTKIVEVEIYRSNWHGAKGHEERKQQRMAMQT